MTRGPVNLDLVVTAAPSETLKAILGPDAIGSALSVETNPSWVLSQAQLSPGKDWKADPLLIPDRDANRWEQTDPISQIEWTHDKNRRTNGQYVNVVKVLKWWWGQHSSGRRGVPKGYLIERLVGLRCPDGKESVAQGVTETLEEVRDAYGTDVRLGRTPFVPDTGIPSNNVFKRVLSECFGELYGAVHTCATKARAAFDDPVSNSISRKWTAIFGGVFPPPSIGGGGSGGGPVSGVRGFQRPSTPATPGKTRFA